MSKYERQNRYNQPVNKRSRRRGLAVFLVLLSLIIVISDRQQKTLLASGRLTVDDFSSKVMSGIAFPIRGVELLFSSWNTRSETVEKNIILKAENERLRVYENQVLDLKMRVRRFEEIFGIDTSSDIPSQKIVTRVVSEANGPFAHSALINIGKNKGVKIGYAVMTVDGLYGHVVNVGRISSRVLLLNDLNSGVSVMSQRSLSRAILVGHNTARPWLEYISPESDWQSGDRIVTSGDGGVLPRGLEIGEVVVEEANRLRVELFTQSQPIDWVWVLPFTPIQKPKDGAEELSLPSPPNLEEIKVLDNPTVDNTGTAQ
ncbi:MAG: rod shape-determining protein MreC [Robiginitomaculum sp.]|nr:rod shape-determining protein MreC [Robiginitomaculum sp.]